MMQNYILIQKLSKVVVRYFLALSDLNILMLELNLFFISE